jgi:hypothetical protein
MNTTTDSAVQAQNSTENSKELPWAKVSSPTAMTQAGKWTGFVCRVKFTTTDVFTKLQIKGRCEILVSTTKEQTSGLYVSDPDVGALPMPAPGGRWVGRGDLPITFEVTVAAAGEHFVDFMFFDADQSSPEPGPYTRVFAEIEYANTSGGNFEFDYTHGINSSPGNDPSTPWGTEIGKKQLLITLTDSITENDALPYRARAPFPDNAPLTQFKELCLRAEERPTGAIAAGILVDIPEITDIDQRKKYKYRIIDKSTGAMVTTESFETNEAQYSDLVLGNEKMINFELQIGRIEDAGKPFYWLSKINATLLADRSNFWFEPYSSDFGWRTSSPEKRRDIKNEYASPQIDTYVRESLQSIYELLKSTNASGGVPKTSYLSSTISCFGEFIAALKGTYTEAQLNDLNPATFPRLSLVSVVALSSYAAKRDANRFIQIKQTTQDSDANPTFAADQNPVRKTWVADAVQGINDSRLTNACLAALWNKEGSMKLNSQNTMSNYQCWPVFSSAASSSPPATNDDAKTIYAYDVAYIALGADFLLKKSGGSDNQPDLTDFSKALQFFTDAANSIGGSGTAVRVLSQLSVTNAGTVQNPDFRVTATGDFYVEMLKLAARYYLSNWQQEGADITYISYNMGATRFSAFRTAFNNTQYPERQRLGMVDWAIHYEIRPGEYLQPRGNAHRFLCYRLAFENNW